MATQIKEPKETRYSKHGGKITIPLAPDDLTFIEGMTTGDFKKKKHRSYAVLLYYTAIRESEGLRCVPENFQISKDAVVFDAGKRLKHGKTTPPLLIPRAACFVDELINDIQATKRKERIWPYCRKTGYNIVDRAFGFYPHFFRLSRITNFFLEGWTIPQVKSWTGLTLTALEYYVGTVDIINMGKSLKHS